MKRSKAVALVLVGALPLAACGDSKPNDRNCATVTGTQAYNDCRDGQRVSGASGSSSGSSFVPHSTFIPVPIGGVSSPVRSSSTSIVTAPARSSTSSVAVSRGGFGGSGVAMGASSSGG